MSASERQGGRPSIQRPSWARSTGDAAEPRTLARALALEHRFWPRLDAPFANFITTLPTDRTSHPDDPTEILYGANALPAWANDVREAAENAFEEATASLDRSARSLKAVASVRGRFRGGLRKALAPLGASVGREEGGEAA